MERTIDLNMRRIGFDARFLTRPMRGMPLYFVELCRRVPDILPEYEFVLYLNTTFEHNVKAESYLPLLEELQRKPNIRLHDIGGDNDEVWEQIRLPWMAWRDGIKLLFMPGNRRPALSPCPTVVAIHDVMEWLFPERIWPTPAGAGPKLKLFFWRRRLYLRWMYGNFLRRSQKVVTVSHFSAEEIHAHLHIPLARMLVAYHGLPEIFNKAASEAVVPRSQRKMTLMLGGDGYQKNPEGAIAAWAKVPEELRRQHPLHITGFVGGHDSPLLQAIRKEGLEGEITIEGWADEAKLGRLFREATVFFFLSRYEGFGFPLLQAMAAGTPVVHSSAASLSELGGGAGIAVSPDQPEEAALALSQFMADENLWAEKVAAGRKWAAAFSWDNSAKLHAEAFAEIAKS